MPKTREKIEALAIDRDMPPPARRVRSVAGQTAEQMQVGDSVLCESVREMQRIRDAMRYRGYTYTTRKSWDTASQGYRIWRLS